MQKDSFKTLKFSCRSKKDPSSKLLASTFKKVAPALFGGLPTVTHDHKGNTFKVNKYGGLTIYAKDITDDFKGYTFNNPASYKRSNILPSHQGCLVAVLLQMGFILSHPKSLKKIAEDFCCLKQCVYFNLCRESKILLSPFTQFSSPMCDSLHFYISVQKAILKER